MTILRLVLGDQLNPEHSWFHAVDDEVLYLMMEVRSETDYVCHHAQKVLAIFAAMRDFARHIGEKGHRIRYFHILDPDNRQSLTSNLALMLATDHFQRLEWQAPDEWRVDRQLAVFAASCGIPAGMVSSHHFLTERHDAAALFTGHDHWLMETFYRSMRRRYQILLDQNGRPEGGRWNYDHDNRKPWPGSPLLPPSWQKSHDHAQLWNDIQDSGVVTLGCPSAEDFPWPVNRQEALELLAHFVRYGLPHFGDYQDAMSTQSPYLYHSLLSFAMNTKMLQPLEVIKAAEDAWRTGLVSLAAVEGFIRQILGWREYVRGFYWAHMPDYLHTNYFGHQRPLPDWFWDGDTRMRCLSQVIHQSLDLAYAHHIQRLMVTGNFALLAGLDPLQLHEWYLGIYIDAFEWVEMPNTLGMSQYADGGRLASKPYVASASYMHRMSDYCKGCHYDRKARYGETACPLNALYWNFHLDHQEKLSGHPRLFHVYRYLDKIDDQEKQQIRLQAAGMLANLSDL